MESVKSEKPFFFLHLHSAKNDFSLLELLRWSHFLLRHLVGLQLKTAFLKEPELFGVLPNKSLILAGHKVRALERSGWIIKLAR